MRRKTMVLVALAAFAVACSQHMSRRYVQYADSYATVVNTVADLVENGTITPEDGRKVQGFLKILRKRIDEFREAIARDEPRDTLDVILASVEDALLEVNRQISFAKDRGGAQ